MSGQELVFQMAEEESNELSNGDVSWDESYRKKLKANMTKKSEETAEGCRVWTGCKDKQGYGRTWVKWHGRREMPAYRVAYILHHKLTPDTLVRRDENDNQLVCSHICRRKACVRHIVLEKNSTSMERLHCRNQGVCTKGHEPHCYLVEAKVPTVIQKVDSNYEDNLFEEIEETVFFVPGFSNRKGKNLTD